MSDSAAPQQIVRRALDVLEALCPMFLAGDAVGAVTVLMHALDAAEKSASTPVEKAPSPDRLAMIEAMLAGQTPMERWDRHTGVTTIADLRQWAERQLREVLIMRAGREKNGGPPEDDMEQYLIGKQAALSPLLANFRQVVERAGGRLGLSDLARSIGTDCLDRSIQEYGQAAERDEFAANMLGEAGAERKASAERLRWRAKQLTDCKAALEVLTIS